MSDLSYYVVRKIGMPIVWVTSRAVVLHADRAARSGAYILASNHLSPYDVAGLIAVTPRMLDFLSIVEMKKNALVHRFFTLMNCVFTDRSRSDPAAVHRMARKLLQGRVVAMFPEAGIRREENSVINGGPFKPGVIRLAAMTKAPIIPCVILGTDLYFKFSSWYPFRAVRFGVNYGEPIFVENDKESATEQLKRAYIDLTFELRIAIARAKGQAPQPA